MGSTVWDMFMYMFGGGMFDTLISVLSDNPSSADSDFNVAWQIMEKAYTNIAVPVGLGLMVIWFLVGFMQKSISEQMNFDQIFLLCVKLVVAFFLIENGIKIFAELWGLGNSLMTTAKDSLSGTGGADGETSGLLGEDILGPVWKDFTGKDWEKKPGFMKSLGCIAQLLFPWLVCWVLSGIATFIAYTRVLEMMVRVALAPIALSDFIVEGLHGGAWRYIKTFFAICLQGFVILMIALIYSGIVAGLLKGATFMDMTVTYLVVTIACVSLMFKSLSLCKELVGVQ